MGALASAAWSLISEKFGNASAQKDQELSKIQEDEKDEGSSSSSNSSSDCEYNSN